jgi:hypothetical protein
VFNAKKFFGGTFYCADVKASQKSVFKANSITLSSRGKRFTKTLNLITKKKPPYFWAGAVFWVGFINSVYQV